MKNKTNIRYLGFRSTNQGGRIFNFCVWGPAVADFLTSFEIPARFFAGADRLRLQEGVGICYAKLKQLVETGMLTEVPSQLCLTASDLEQYREVVPAAFKRRPLFDEAGHKIP